MNRVIRNAEVENAPQFFGGTEPTFFDERVRALVARAEADAYQRGHAEGVAEGRGVIDGATARIEAALATASQSLSRTHLAAVSEAMEVAFAVAAFVIGRAPHDDGVVVADRIRDALQGLDEEEVTVFVSPGDWDVVAGSVAVPLGVTVERDARLEPGEARIRGAWSAVDMTRDAALRVAAEVMR